MRFAYCSGAPGVFASSLAWLRAGCVLAQAHATATVAAFTGAAIEAAFAVAIVTFDRREVRSDNSSRPNSPGGSRLTLALGFT